MRQQYDGNDYQFWTQLLIGLCVIGLLIDRFGAYDPNSTVFGLSIFFLIVGIFMVPEGPKPPEP